VVISPPFLPKKAQSAVGISSIRRSGQLHHHLAGVVGAVSQGLLSRSGFVDRFVPVADDLKKSLLRLIDIMRGLPQDLTVLPGHGSPFRIQDAFRMNPYIIQLT